MKMRIKEAWLWW